MVGDKINKKQYVQNLYMETINIAQRNYRRPCKWRYIGCFMDWKT